MRIMNWSTRPPAKPAIAPHATPITSETNVAMNPTASEICSPISSRATMSRPRMSVPSQCMFSPVGAIPSLSWYWYS